MWLKKNHDTSFLKGKCICIQLTICIHFKYVYILNKRLNNGIEECSRRRIAVDEEML